MLRDSERSERERLAHEKHRQTVLRRLKLQKLERIKATDLARVDAAFAREKQQAKEVFDQEKRMLQEQIGARMSSEVDDPKARKELANTRKKYGLRGAQQENIGSASGAFKPGLCPMTKRTTKSRSASSGLGEIIPLHHAEVRAQSGSALRHGGQGGLGWGWGVMVGVGGGGGWAGVGRGLGAC